MKKSFFLLFFFIFYLNTYSQNLKNETFNIIQKNLNYIIQNREYVVYEWSERIYIVIVKINSNKFIEFKFEKDNNEVLFLKDVTTLSNNTCLDKVFDYKNLSKDYIDYQSEFYKNKEVDYNGMTIYFAMITSDGSVYGECRITTIANILPYDRDIHLFLLNRVINDPKILKRKCGNVP
ncbi:hypothetical protein M0M57_07290 [Flavobacterium azooxidireducens]|uniref:Uncharacterized protein n=1 Tax=Flavobacterium azooxidireducens TaxID=1871076 RepID=A0ABY4KK11_9FLAO|nr:hypothetical protein [Flavobacterium azooxidireducens]UPQ80636.1 hypothetical protein M0M57_07290 [Flavobacterium azooxidireducens]